jgi:trimeric autotransporter adhesin
VKRYLTQTVYHYISTPVSNQDISPEFVNTASNPLPATVDFYKFDEPANLWRNIKDASGNLNSNFETQFAVNRGYAYANSNATYTKTFTGDLNYSNQAVSLTRTGGTGSEGWNLVGNPFPSTLAANDGADETNNFLDDNTAALDDSYEALYFFNIDDYVSLNQASPPLFVSPSQGFFVKAATDGAQLQFNTTIQKHASASFYKNANIIAHFIIGITSPQNDYNETYISFINGTSKGLDPGYDARKLKGNPNIALFSKLVDDDGGDYSIQSLPVVEAQQVYLGLDAMQPGLYQFGNVQMIDLPYQTVMLEDKVENVYIDLNQSSTYSFSTTQTGMNLEDRFMLHFGGIVTDLENDLDVETDITIFSDGEFIFLQNLADKTMAGPVHLYTLAGQLLDIRKIEMDAHDLRSIPTNYAAGMYLVKFQSNNVVFTQKVFLE